MAFLDSALHINVPLTDYAVAFRTKEDEYMWDKLLPPKVVSKRSDIIRQIDKGNLLRKYDLRVGTGGRIPEVQFKVSQNFTYNAVDYAVRAVLRESERANADSILQYDQEMMYHALISMHTNLEVLTIKDTLRDPLQLTNNVTLALPTFWDNYNSPGSNPLADLKTAVLSIRARTEHMPNVILMHDLVWDALQRHPIIVARGPVHPFGAGIITIPIMEEILNVRPGTIKVTSKQYNVAKEGDPIADFRSMIGPDVIVAYVEPPSTRSYGLGTTFMFQGKSEGSNYTGENLDVVPGLGGAPFVVYQFPNYEADSRGAQSLNLVGGIDQRVLVQDAGYLIRNVVDKTNFTKYGNFLNN